MPENKQQLNLVRIFNAPIEKVWEAWTTPAGWAAWYGKPGNVPEESVEIDLQEGGRWKSTTIYGEEKINFGGEFKEIEQNQKLVITIDEPADPENTFFETVTVHFKSTEDGKTEMDFTQSGNLPPEEYDVGLREGWTGFFDALQAYVEN